MSEPGGKRKLDPGNLSLLKVPPHSVEAEQAVLGGLMLDNSAWDRVSDKLMEEDFYRHEHQLIYRVMFKHSEAGKPLDVVTMVEALDNLNELENAGGLEYLGDLASNARGTANIEAYTDIIRERATLRRLIRVANEIADDSFNPAGRESAELVDIAEQKVFQIADSRAADAGPRPINPLLKGTVERIDELFKSKGAITGLSTGYTDLDGKTSGLQKSDLIIVAGRPSMGKTSFAMNLVEHAVVHENKPVLVFSLEMPAESLVFRMISSIGRIDQTRLRSGRLDEEDWPKLTAAVGKLKDRPLFIDDTPGLSPMEMRSRARRIVREHGQLGLVVVDYLQLMQIKGYGDNRVGEISEISRSLKQLAREFECPVIALSQLNRSLEQRPNKRPVMSDLRECVTGDTLVSLADGRRLPISTLEGTQPEVWAMNADQKLVKAQSDLVWKVGKKPVYRLCLTSGRELRATGQHRIFSGRGWATLVGLTAGDRVALASIDQSNSAVQLEQEGDLFWDRIAAIIPDGEEDVYDLTVPGPASWLADGVVCHNSGAIEQDADIIAFVYRDEVYNPDTEEKGVAEIIIGKQRNGPIGTVRLAFQGQYTRFENLSIPDYDDSYTNFG